MTKRINMSQCDVIQNYWQDTWDLLQEMLCEKFYKRNRICQKRRSLDKIVNEWHFYSIDEHLSDTTRNFQTWHVRRRRIKQRLEKRNFFKESSKHSPKESDGIDANEWPEEASRFAKRREILFAAMPPGTLVVGEKGRWIESRPDHRVFECTSARLGTRNCFDIGLARGTTATLRQFVIPRSCTRRCV